jgi:site-specific recombinase XerD
VDRRADERDGSFAAIKEPSMSRRTARLQLSPHASSASRLTALADPASLPGSQVALPPEKRIHDLRHQYASHLVNAGRSCVAADNYLERSATTIVSG